MRRKIDLAVCLAGVLSLGLIGCGKKDDAAKPATPTVNEGTKPAATDKKPEEKKPDGKKDEGGAAAEGWGTIKGQIVFDGTPPEPTVLVKEGDPNAKDPATCAAHDVLSEELVVNKENKGLRWVIVYLGGKPKVHPDLQKVEGSAELGQKNCQFIPHVLAMRAGQKFVITSDDPVAHNTKGDGFKNPGFNPVVPPAGDGQSKLDGPDLVAENLPINISCSIHPWMKAYVGVYNHPYFAVTDENGNFTIENVPAGELKLNIWHEKGYGEGGKEGKAISVKANETTDLGQIKYTAK